MAWWSVFERLRFRRPVKAQHERRSSGQASNHGVPSTTPASLTPTGTTELGKHAPKRSIASSDESITSHTSLIEGCFPSSPNGGPGPEEFQQSHHPPSPSLSQRHSIDISDNETTERQPRGDTDLDHVSSISVKSSDLKLRIWRDFTKRLSEHIELQIDTTDQRALANHRLQTLQKSLIILKDRLTAAKISDSFTSQAIDNVLADIAQLSIAENELLQHEQSLTQSQWALKEMAPRALDDSVDMLNLLRDGGIDFRRPVEESEYSSISEPAAQRRNSRAEFLIARIDELEKELEEIQPHGTVRDSSASPLQQHDLPSSQIMALPSHAQQQYNSLKQNLRTAQAELASILPDSPILPVFDMADANEDAIPSFPLAMTIASKEDPSPGIMPSVMKPQDEDGYDDVDVTNMNEDDNDSTTGRDLLMTSWLAGTRPQDLLQRHREEPAQDRAQSEPSFASERNIHSSDQELSGQSEVRQSEHSVAASDFMRLGIQGVEPVHNIEQDPRPP